MFFLKKIQKIISNAFNKKTLAVFLFISFLTINLFVPSKPPILEIKNAHAETSIEINKPDSQAKLGVPEAQAGVYSTTGGILGGAVTGAAVGSAVPVVGTAIGAVVGGVAGGLAGYLLPTIIGKAVYIAEKGIAMILNGFFKIITVILGVVLVLAANLANWVLQIGEFVKNPVVQQGWNITKGLANLFFILILLTIAFATILRIETYGVKKVLPKLIIAALLINFSMLITGVIIDFTQVIATFFLEAGAGTSQVGTFDLALRLSDGLNLYMWQEIPTGTWEQQKIDPILGSLISGIGSIVFILGAIVVFLLTAFLLLIRIMVLWFLIILAPLAWLAWILPNTSSMWNKWWRELLRWAFLAPILTFFIYLTLLTVQTGGAAKLAESGFTPEPWLKGMILLILNYVFLLFLLFGGLIMAQRISIYGAQGTMAVAKFIGKGAAGTVSRGLAQWKVPGAETFGRGMSGLGDKLAGKRFVGGLGARLKTGGEVLTETKGRGVLSPGAWKRSWPEWRKETERRAYAIPTAQLQDQIAGIFSLGKDRSDYTERTKRQQRIEERKKIVTVNAEELVGGFQRSLGTKDQSKTAAYAQALAEQGDLNDLLRVSGYEFNAEGISQFTEKELKPLLGEQDAYRLGFDLTKALEKVGQWPGRIFKGEYDPRTGKTTYTNLIEKSIKDTGTTDKGVKESLEGSYKAWSRMDPQEKSRFTHRLGFISENEKGENTGIKGHEMFIMGLSAAPANVIRMQDEVKATLMLRHADETKTLNRELYDRLSEIFEKMSTDQIDQMRDMLQKTEAGVVRSTWVPGGGTTIY